MLYSSFLVGAAVSPVIYAQLPEAVGDYSFGFIWSAVFPAISTSLCATLPRFPYGAELVVDQRRRQAAGR